MMAEFNGSTISTSKQLPSRIATSTALPLRSHPPRKEGGSAVHLAPCGRKREKALNQCKRGNRKSRRCSVALQPTRIRTVVPGTLCVEDHNQVLSPGVDRDGEYERPPRCIAHVSSLPQRRQSRPGIVKQETSSGLRRNRLQEPL